MPGFYLSLPVLFFKFWFLDAPIRLIRFFLSVNHATLQILSLPLMVRTFFKPLKNEYRKGLVVFSIFFGIFMKSALIFADLIMFSVVLLVEAIFLILFVGWPILTFYILFI